MACSVSRLMRQESLSMVTSVALWTRRSTVPAMTRFSRHDTESAGYRVKRKNRTAKNEWRNGKDATPYQARPRNRARNQGKSTDVAFYPLTAAAGPRRRPAAPVRRLGHRGRPPGRRRPAALAAADHRAPGRGGGRRRARRDLSWTGTGRGGVSRRGSGR